MRRAADRGHVKFFAREWVSVLFGFVLVFAGFVPALLSQYLLVKYSKSSSETEAKVVKFFRLLGSEEDLLDACYGLQRDKFNLWGLLRADGVTPEIARALYYRVSGSAFNSVQETGAMEYHISMGRSWDMDLGGESVGRVVEDLSLKESRMEGLIDTDVGVGYVEWTMVFLNEGFQDKEARMMISLPQGGVVSRLSLWVNGEVREAAFGTSAQVRSAYQRVAVLQRKDPILVNWAGPDLVFAQCFPVPTSNGEMKVRLGVSFPLQVSASGVFSSEYPAFVEKNFLDQAGFQHDISLQLRSGGEIVDLVQSVSNAEFGKSSLVYPAGASKFLEQAHVVSASDFEGRHIAFRPEFTGAHSVEGEHVAVVVNGSVGMRTYANSLAKWLRGLETEVTLYFAGDQVLKYVGSGSSCAEWLSQQKFVGGQNNTPALIDALNDFSGLGGDTLNEIYFFGGSQPVEFDNPISLKRVFEKVGNEVEIWACLLDRLNNVLYRDGILSFAPVLYLNSEGELGDWSINYTVDVSASKVAGYQSKHVFRLWLAEKLRKDAKQFLAGVDLYTEDALSAGLQELALRAARNYLVTQLTGAVVLETDEQYEADDLEAGESGRVPNIPEHNQYALVIGLVTLCLVCGARRRS